ncbi:phosphatidylserine synthase [Trypanosoma grayi]|uniref:phosphatidylserine synthase n=1 Tax=Trypanosoma grayi TaxID=71804 RepID=UPI0004F43484|nr:phosphatidylserine synthase [Trypanosoma grayi]KEG12732.1 phosphatidylserine synthase [Trypanosoma grayi]
MAKKRHANGEGKKVVAERNSNENKKNTHPKNGAEVGSSNSGHEMSTRRTKAQHPTRKNDAQNGQLKPPHPYLREFDFTDLAYTPHTLTALVVLVSVILFMVRYYYYPHMSVVASVKLGLCAASLSFIVFGMLHLPDSLLVRPHPCVWRVVLTVALMYLALLSFMLFQNLETVRAIIGLYDPALLLPLPERQYAEDCRISTPDNPYLFFHTAFDVFIIAHALGYFVKTIILRDWRAATCVSVGFEIIEVTFQHVLPNFKECWWDHLLLDVLLCNAGGTLLGMMALRRLRAKEFHWVALCDIKGCKMKAQRILGQLGPRSFMAYEWNVFHTPKRFLQFAGLLALLFLQEVNCFTMKHILQIPSNHHLVTARLAMWSFIAMPTVREYYEYINTADHKGKRFGTTAWVGLLALLLETILITKLAIEGSYFQEPMPSYIAVPWMVALLIFALWFALFFGAVTTQERMTRRGFLYAVSNVLFYSGCCCVLAAFVMGMPDLQIGRASFERFISPYESRVFFWREMHG